MPSIRLGCIAALLLPILLWTQPVLAEDESPSACDLFNSASPFDLESLGERLAASAVGCDQNRLVLDFGIAEADSMLPLAEAERYVKDEFDFYGLAGFYSITRLSIVNADGISRVEEHVELSGRDWLSVMGRFTTIGLQAPGATVEVDESGARLRWQRGSPVRLTAVVGSKTNLADIDPVFAKTRYSHLWDWLGALSLAVESSLEFLHSSLGMSWGWVIVIFSVLVKILLLPVSFMTVRFQRSVSQHQTQLEPILREIKENYDGEEAHNRIMAAHKDLGISPFFTLKPLLGSFIQVPILVAIFNALGEMPQLAGDSFLWIGDLAYPDTIGQLPFAIPLLGNTVSLLPFVMTVVTVASTLHYRNRHAPASAVQAQKKQLYLMAAAFFVLFYPFPAGMLLYWTMANILQWAQQHLIKV